jgi:hypothetical protein
MRMIRRRRKVERVERREGMESRRRGIIAVGRMLWWYKR